MNENEWLDCNSTWPMFCVLRGRVSRRKGHLFALACCLRVLRDRPYPDEANESAMAVVQEYIENQITKTALRAARAECQARLTDHHTPETILRRAIFSLLHEGGYKAALDVAGWCAGVCWLESESGREIETQSQAALIRDVFGNPFRPVALDPAWRTATVTSLAEAIYAERAFDRLPILADALEDAGCTNADILDHCRGPGVHARGCWVVDLVLAKS